MKLKKRKLKTKKLLKITILVKQEPLVQSAEEPKQGKSEFEEICIHQNLNWPLQHLYLKIDSGFHARDNRSEARKPESN